MPTRSLSQTIAASLSRLALVALALAVLAPLEVARAQTKVACIGEQTTHSAHREEDPEFPERLGGVLDDDFMADPTPEPEYGGFWFGKGSNFEVHNFGHPTGTVLDYDKSKPKTYLKTAAFEAAQAASSDVVVLGPFGHHEEESGGDMNGFEADMRALAEAVVGFDSQPLVLVALPIPIGGQDDDQVMRDVRAGTQAVADELDLETIDLWNTFLDHSEWFRDGTHLTDEGKQTQASTVAAAIVAALEAEQQMEEMPPDAVDVPTAMPTAMPSAEPSAQPAPAPDTSAEGQPMAMPASDPTTQAPAQLPLEPAALGAAPMSADSGGGCSLPRSLGSRGAPLGTLLLFAFVAVRLGRRK